MGGMEGDLRWNRRERGLPDGRPKGANERGRTRGGGEGREEGEVILVNKAKNIE